MIATSQSQIIRDDSIESDAASRISPFQFTRTSDAEVRASRILIIDDEPAVGLLLKKHLNDAQFSQFDLVTEGAGAFEHISDSSPDLVLLDIHLGDANGLDILQRMRATAHLEHTPVIILTQSSDEKTKSTALNLGANDFLTKPVVVSELLARVRNVLSARVYQEEVVRFSLQQESDLLHDALTGVPNRRAFDYEVKRRMSEWRRNDTPMTLLMVSIDLFSVVIEQRDQEFRNRVLRSIANILKSSAREMDLVSRYRDDVFGLLLPSTDAGSAVQICRELQLTMSQTTIQHEGHPVPISVSIGLAGVIPGDDAEHLTRRAEMALETATQNTCASIYEHDGATCVSLAQRLSRWPAVAGGNAASEQQRNRDILHARIAIIDDEPATIAIAQKYLRDRGFTEFIPIDDSTRAVETIRQEQPDLVLLDLKMPEVNGFDILESMIAEPGLKNIPVLVLTATQDKEEKVRALSLGAADFLEKPVHRQELVARIENTLMAKANLEMLRNYSFRLEREVKVRMAEVTASRREAVQCLARAAEMRDNVTGRHVIRVGRFAAIIARELGFREERITWVEHAAQLHDVGKIGIADAILHKPGKLTDKEFEIMQGHCLAGIQIIEETANLDEHDGQFPNEKVSASPMMHLASVVAGSHHEKWDGTGYPQGLKGIEIPIEGRITAIADVFDALSTRRPYKPAIPMDKCLEMMEQKRGSHFDPVVLAAFVRRRSEIIQAALDLADWDVPQ